MIVVYYTNCQFIGIDIFLKDILKYEKYYIENYSLIKNKGNIPIDIIQKADIFIYQPIDKKHGIYSTDISIENNILSHIPPHCKKISFPYIYNSALWILIPPNDSDTNIGNISNVEKYTNSQPIEKLKAQGYLLDEIIEMYRSGNIDFNYQERFDNSIKILKEKETICNVKISDFILKNIKKHKLFFTQNHPNTCIFIHCVNQILSILNYNEYYPDEFQFPDNLINLPGVNYHTSYDIKYWNFDYQVDKDLIDDELYIKHIKSIYNNYII